MALKRVGGLDDLAKEISKTHSSRAQQLADKLGIVLPTGSTMANLALSDTIEGGYPSGSIVNMVGDSSAGKSMLLWTLFAELCSDPKYDDYDLYFDDAEAANSFDEEKLFSSIKNRIILIEPPSETIEEWYINLYKCLETGRPFVYGLDSFDALGSKDDTERIETLAKKGELPGSYGGSKPKLASEIFRNVVTRIKKSNSLVFIISQTRDKIGAMAFQKKSTKSGGRAMKFYSHQEIWLSVIGSIQKDIKGKKREIGVDVQFSVEKNKRTGKRRKVNFPILYEYGIDDIESCISWLIEEKFWSSSGAGISVSGFSFEELQGTIRKADLIKRIEELGAESELRSYVGECWAEIEDALCGKRKPKYNSGDR